MEQRLGEKRIKALQKEFLAWIEAHPTFYALEPAAFNDLRKRVFRGTFKVFTLGVTGLEAAPDISLWTTFFGWLNDHDVVTVLDPETRLDVADKCFRVALEAYRVGAMVASVHIP